MLDDGAGVGGNADDVSRAAVPAMGHYWLQLVLAAVVGVVLIVPRLGLSYVFDDFDFLGRTQFFRPELLLPIPGAVFYRPVSRELFFGFLNAVSPGSPLLGHLLNALSIAAAICLTGDIARRLAGFRAGIYSAMALATFGQMAVLVAWVCGDQDLLAIVFTLLAVHLELRRKGRAGVLAAAAAILSKETAVAALPALLVARWLASRSRKEVSLACVRLGSLLLAWGVVHPGLHLLAAHGGANTAGSYIGLNNPQRWSSLARSLPTLLNLPLTGWPTPWPKDLTWALLLAAVPVLGAGALLSASGKTPDAGDRACRPIEVGTLALALAVPPLLLTCLVVQHWAPYYACFSAPGMAIFFGERASRVRVRWAMLGVVVLLVMGFWSRGVKMEPGMPTEQGLVPAGKALPEVKRGFKRVAPTLPRSAIVYVSTMATGAQSVYVHLHRFQVLRIWYRDPSIQTLRPELRVLSDAPALLFFVAPDRSVVRVDPNSLNAMSSSGHVDWRLCRTTLRLYAFGLAQTGEISQAVSLLLRLEPTGTVGGAIDQRLAAMLLLSRGETSAGREMLRGAPGVDLLQAVTTVAQVMMLPTRGTPLDAYALEAFDLPQNSLGLLRVLLRTLTQYGYSGAAGRVASRILALNPHDSEAALALRRATVQVKTQGVITAPLRLLEFP